MFGSRQSSATCLLLACGASLYSASPIEPLTELKKPCPDTQLARNGVALAAIYHPPEPEFRAAARELSDIIHAKYDVLLPVRPDDPTGTWHTDEGNILALGNMGNSRILRTLYYRELIAPGVTRRRLRVTLDPFADGRNVVMLGGIDLANVKLNFQPLLDRLQCPAPGTLVLPPLFDPLPTIDAGDKERCARYIEELPRMPPRYGAYHAGWAGSRYAATGHEDFARLYRESLLRLVREKYYVHLYLFREFRGWELAEASPVFSDAERLAIVNFFRESVAHPDEGIDSDRYFGTRKNLRSIRSGRLILGNHPSQAACGIMVVADYLRKHYPSELHEAWYRDALEFFDLYRDRGCYLGDDETMQASSISNIMTAVYRTEDNPANHPFLRNVLGRLMPNYNNFGTFPAYGDMLRPSRFGREWYKRGALLYNDPGLLWMHHFIRTAVPDRPASIPAEKPKPDWFSMDIVPRRPAGFVGLSWAEPDDTLFSLADKHWAETCNVTMADCYGRAAFRGGATPRDDYLLLDGVHLGHAYDDQNGFLEYSSLGRTWLVSLDYCYGTPQSAHNVLSATRDGISDPDLSKLAVRRKWADLSSFAATRTVLYAYGRGRKRELDHLTSDWERNVLWLKNRFFVVFDRVIAREKGIHSATGFWRMVGERRDLPNGIQMTQHGSEGKCTFRLTCHGADTVAPGREKDPQAGYLFHREGKLPPPLDNVPHVIHMLKAHKARPLNAGESFTLAACFWARSEQRPVNVTSESIGENTLRVTLDGQPMLAACGPVDTGRLKTDAELSLLAPDRIRLVGARTLAVDGTTVCQSPVPLSFEWNLDTGACEVIAGAASEASFAGHALSLPAGNSTHTTPRPPKGFAETMSGIINSLPVAETPHPKRRPPAPPELTVVAKSDCRSPVRCLWAGRLGTDEGIDVLVGHEDGTVERLCGDSLTSRWTYRCKDVINSVDAGDTTGNGVPEIAVGSDDHQLHLLSPLGKRLWTWDPPFDELKARIAYKQWLWSEPFVKKVAMHDINGDGKAEIVVGAGMNTFAVNGAGEQLWAFEEKRDHHPTMTAVAFADVDGDGRDEPVGGASDMWYHGSPVAIGPNGRQLRAYPSDGWVSGVKAILAEDLEGKGHKALIYGTRAGGLRCCPNVEDEDRERGWYRRFADLVDQVATLGRAGGGKVIAAAGGDTQWVTAFGPSGTKLWAVYLDSPVATMAADNTQGRLYVGCDDGTVQELDPKGNVLASTQLRSQPTASAPHPTAGIVIGTRDGGVYVLKGAQY